MTEPKTIQINGVDYVRADSVKATPEYAGDVKIVILQRGWVMVGRFERGGTKVSPTSQCRLHTASVIRVWGTKKGLGEIAQNGPTSTTVLDPTGGTVEFDYLTVVAAIACNEAKWSL